MMCMAALTACWKNVRRRSAGLQVSWVKPDDLAGIEAAIRPDTRMIWVETPTNPLLKLADLSAIAAIARRHNLISVADNTFASPAIHRPLEHGFDIVVHSATKYLNGHSDVVAGLAVVGDNSGLAEKLGYLQNAVGGVLDPFSSFLTLRGIRTLALRMERHSANALQFAEWLEQQPEVERVWFPWLASHPHHQLARQQMALPGGMISVVVKGDEGYAERIISKLRWFTLAESLGGVESLVEPALQHDPCLDPAGETPGERYHTAADPPVGGDRRSQRSDCRLAAGAAGGVIIPTRGSLSARRPFPAEGGR
ncbi:cystathionine gamma-lyase [Klebsiella pneumoniae]|uniref:Cystathionine gamma-lyase n=1 Tax=Klebsiella pneumoniae TaxID=573 RepID=A0A377VBL2_KLEPN|nr:cystathionine gamma-lyase [Klebsiella pneumoniae]